MNLCKYKDVFGMPNKGVHSYRIFNIAIIDVLFTLLAAYIISAVFHYCLWKTTAILFLLGILAHRAFCVRTTIDKWLFL